MNQDISFKKLETLKEILSNSKDFTDFCQIEDFRKRYPFKDEEWNLGFNKITTEVNEEVVLLFIGPFSSGKSTFVNALIGEDILPTKDTPCTAVITEIQFKKGGEHTGKIFKKDGTTQDCNFSELKDIINGPTGAAGEVSTYHHVVVELAVDELKNKEFRQFVGKVKIVDCPGFGSPYYSNEDVINDYMQSSNFTFWLTPHNKFGGQIAKDHLSEIKRKTQTLIPVITKSDTISSNKSKDKITAEFRKELGDMFKLKEPVFVSAVKWQEGEKLRISLEKNREKLSSEKIQKFEQQIQDLIKESNIANVMGRMSDSAQNKEINSVKITACKAELLEILADIKKVATDESSYWKNILLDNGISVENVENKYVRIDEAKKNVDRWISDNIRELADNINTAILSKLSKCEKPSQTDISRCINQVLQEEQPKIRLKLNEKLKNIYKPFLKEKRVTAEDIEQIPIGELSVEDLTKIFGPIRDTLFGLLDSLRGGEGFRTTLIAASGGALMVTATSLSGFEIFGVAVGSGLATVVGVAGAALIGVAVVPLLPTIIRNINKLRADSDEKARNEFKNKMAEGFREQIQPGLDKSMRKINENYYNSVTAILDQTNQKAESNYKKIAKTIEKLSETIDSLNKNF